MTTTLERDLRDALQRQADSIRPTPRTAPDRARRDVWWVAVAALLLPVVLLVGAVLTLERDGERREVVPVAGGDVTWAILELPGASVSHRSDPARLPPPADAQGDGRTLQVFRRPGRLDGPMVFVTTLRPYDPASFGLVDAAARGVELVSVLGVEGHLARWQGPDGAAVLSAELGDGSAIFVNAIGLTDDELVAFVDNLAPSADGWTPSVLPHGIEAIAVEAPAPDGLTWEVGYDGVADVSVWLANSTFEDLLRDRVSSTSAPIEQIDVAGVAAAVGAYGEQDWWVLLEPSPGRAMELRIGGDRSVVAAVIDAVRFVDEATWRAATGGSDLSG